MDCPQCKGYKLEPKEIETGLLAACCIKCEGTMLPLMNYRYWLDMQGDTDINAEVDAVADDSTQAKVCSKCSRFMTKFKIGPQAQNRLDFCVSCDEAWLDKGEWDLLKGLNLHTKLAQIFTEEWQRNIRLQNKAELLKSRYTKILGAEDFARVEEFKAWLNQHDEKQPIMQYLQAPIGG